MITVGAATPKKEPLFRRLEWFLYRYAAVIAAVALMYLFDGLYFEAEIGRLPRLLEWAVVLPGFVAWCLQVFFGIPLLAVAQVVSAAWYLRKHRVRLAHAAWRVALAIVVFAVWAATINRFELP